MSSKLGTLLPRRSTAWFWVAAAAVLALFAAWKASWILASMLGGVALLIALEPRLRKPEHETVQVDEVGVLRIDGDVKEQVSWQEVTEIKIITTDQGPYREDVFFVLVGHGDRACLVPQDAAVRTQLLEEMQKRFPGLNNEMVIKAMGSTSDNTFVIWKKAVAHAA